MFDLERSELGIFHWWDIFIILSLEDNDLYLVYLDFPAGLDTHELRILARKFLNQYHEIGGHHAMYLRFNITEPAEQLFNNTYQTLIEILGTKGTEQFCIWGNKLNFSKSLENALHSFRIDLFLPLDRKATPEYEQFVKLFPEKYKKVLKVIKNYLSIQLKLWNRIDRQEAEPTIWVVHLSELYNFNPEAEGASETSDADEIKFSPFAEVWMSLNENLVKNAIIEIGQILESREIESLEPVIAEIRLKKYVRPPWTPYLSLLETLHHLRSGNHRP